MNTITFQIKKILGAQNKMHGFMVTKSDAPAEDILSKVFSVISAMDDSESSEKWKQKIKQPQEIFCATEKEVKDYISFELGNF